MLDPQKLDPKFQELQLEINKLCDKFGIVAYGIAVYRPKKNEDEEDQVVAFHAERPLTETGMQKGMEVDLEEEIFLNKMNDAFHGWLDFVYGDN